MTDERISKSIGEDVKKFQALLKKINARNVSYDEFLKNPSGTLKHAGISLEAYGTPKVSAQQLAEQFASFTRVLVSAGVGRSLKPGAIMEEMLNANTQEGTYQNFDKSSSSSTYYQNMTDTTPGAQSSKSTGTSAGIKTKFDVSGLSNRLHPQEIFTGPLISQRAFDTIVSNVQAVLKASAHRG